MALALNDAEEIKTTTALSQYFEILVTTLLRTGERPDGNDSNLRASSYDALSNLVAGAPMVSWLNGVGFDVV